MHLKNVTAFELHLATPYLWAVVCALSHYLQDYQDNGISLGTRKE